MEFPKEKRAIFRTEIELHVTRLVDKVNATIGSAILARSQRPHAPSPQTIGATSEIALLKRQYLTVAIRPGNATIGVQGKFVMLVETEQMGILKVEFHILCIRDIEKSVLPAFVFLASDEV